MNTRLAVTCSVCQSAPGEPCVDGRTGLARSTAHAERGRSRFAVRRKQLAKTVKEGNIREALKARVEAYDGEIRAVSWLGRKNAPDVLALFPYTAPVAAAAEFTRTHVFIETKRPGKAATEAQAREHERMRAAGCVVLVIATIQELDAWLPPL